MKYTNYDIDTKKILGYYTADIHGTSTNIFDINTKEEVYDISAIPTPHIQITDAQWQEALSIGANYVDIENNTLLYIDPRTLDDLKKEKIDSINKSCEETITAGFGADALGEVYYYQSSRDDQINLQSYVTTDIDLPLKCSADNETFEFIEHTALQIKKVFDAFTIYKVETLYKANELKKQIDTAKTEEQLKDIVWI